MRNLTTDLYELTMSQSYFDNGMKDTYAYFDVFYRKAPDGAPFAIANGVAEIVEFVTNFHYNPDEIAYLENLGIFSKNFLKYLQNFKFSGDLWAVADGTVIFPNEPVITVRAPIIEAQLIETGILQMFNFASLITTKANRMVRMAKGVAIHEIGSRRAQNDQAAILASLYSYEGGIAATSSVEANRIFGVPVMATMAHSYIQAFDNEYEAFKCHAKSNPTNCVLLIDTYNVLESGVPNAIKINEKVLKPMDQTLKAVRIDSGDLSYLAKEVRAKLDEAGLENTKIILSNSIDEFVIESLLSQKAPVDMFAIGENLVTAKSCPTFGAVYKLSAIEKKGQIVPKIKISDNFSKITLPAFKKVYRLYDSGKKIISDYICLADEPKPSGKLQIKDPDRPWMMKDIKQYSVRNIKFKFVEKGKRILKCLTPEQVRKNIAYEISTLSVESTRLHNPQVYPVNISAALQEVKDLLLQKRYR